MAITAIGAASSSTTAPSVRLPAPTTKPAGPPLTTTAGTAVAGTEGSPPPGAPSSSDAPTSEAPTSTQAPTTTQPEGITDGTFAVGADIRAGRYITSGQSGCYWARLRDASGGLSSIIANENAAGQAIVDIAPTDGAFETHRCGVWRPFGPGNVPTVSEVGDGTFAVGVQLSPGRYRTQGGSGCYWARLKDFGGGIGSIIANDNASGQAIVDVGPTDAGFSTHRCGTWQKVG